MDNGDKMAFTYEDKVLYLQNMLTTQFNQRIVTEGMRLGVGHDIHMVIETIDTSLWITFSKGEEIHSITIPLPFIENGVVLIEKNEVKRALCQYLIEKQQTTITYMDVIYRILCDNPEGLIPDHFLRSIPFVQQIAYAFNNDNAYITVYNTQKAINSVVNKLPLHKTNMNSFVINHRLMIIDRDFDEMSNPEDRLKYQVEKARKYFDRGWTSIGLSDGTLADKNYILTCDIRRLTPFGLKFHNPQRNLYSTLKMEGDELPLVMSAQAKMLAESGITRTGWNLFTAFIDIPDVFEDQLMVDKSLSNLFITYKRRIQCFGTIHVKEGEVLKEGKLLSISKDGVQHYFKTKSDSAVVKKINKTITNVGGRMVETYFITIEMKRNLKEGTKITNTAANKGVIRMADLGFAVDPRTGERRKIDVIVSCKAVQKRKNYSQILEALVNNVNHEQPIVIEENAEPTKQMIEQRLEAEGFPKDGTWMCNTYVGEFPAICGKVFWGVTMDVEDALWEEGDTTKINERGLRTAGLKFSSIEFRALNTRFGKDNPITDEIMSYAQGTTDLHDYIKILKSKRGESPNGVEVINYNSIKPVDQSSGTIIPSHLIKGTIADSDVYPNGFMMKLPLSYQTLVDLNGEVTYEGIPRLLSHEEMPKYKNIYTIDRIYIPGGNIRSSWRHGMGNYGLTEISTLINGILIHCKNMSENPGDSINVTLYYKALRGYFNRVSRKMGSKRGEISNYGMAVRYPFSAKAVATLSNSLPKNVIEIHKDMASGIGVSDGDIVLVERFPCLGFMSLRLQKVKTTEDPACKYTIRVSKNSLGSLSLDFDGDVIYIASFHTPNAKLLMKKEWTNPNKPCYEAISRYNNKSGTPCFKSFTLEDYNITPFQPLTKDKHALIVKTLTSIKANTGPVIALAYNLMRIVENSEYGHNRKANVGVEVFLDMVGNSVFQQKHDGVEAMHEVVKNAICTVNIEALVANEFNRGTSTVICDLIKKKAGEIGIYDLEGHHEGVKSKGGSSVINKIVKTQNSIYFASRSLLEACSLLDCLESNAVDIPSETLKWVTSGDALDINTALDKKVIKNKIDKSIKSESGRNACEAMVKLFDFIVSKNEDTKYSDTKR